MDILKSLLLEIRGGKQTFQPASESTADISAFQTSAKALEFANQSGYLEDYSSSKESYSGSHLYVLCIVKGGLTYKGEMFLNQEPEPIMGESQDIIELKPNFYGIGINLRALMRSSSKKLHKLPFKIRGTKPKPDAKSMLGQPTIAVRQQILEPSESAVFFAERFGQAFPGIRETRWYEGSDAIKRLEVLLKSPLTFENRNGKTTPIWWWRDGNLQISIFRHLKRNTVLLDIKELDVVRIAAVPFSSYYRSFVYLESCAMKSTGIYEWSEEKIQKWMDNFGYAYEEFGLYLNKHFVTRGEFDDNAAFINGKHVTLGSNVELRNRYITPYNLVIASHRTPINNPTFDKTLERILNDILKGRTTIDELVDQVGKLPKQPYW